MKGIGFIALMAVSTASFAQSLTIDDFTTGAFTSTMVLNNGVPADVRFNTGSMFGGSRQVAGTYFTNALNQDMTVSIAGTGLEITNAGAGAAGNVDLQYGGYQAGSSSASLAAYDHFQLVFAANTRTLLTNIFVHDVNGSAYTLQQSMAADPTTPQNFYFSNFTGAGTFDWSQVDAITVSMLSQPGGDYALASITAASPVPEPATLVASALGIAALIARRRKKS